MVDTVTIIEFDGAGNVVSETESEVFSFESADELEKFLNGDYFDDDVDDIAEFDAGRNYSEGAE